MLPAAGALAAVETALLLFVMLTREGEGGGFWALTLSVKLVFCWGVVRRSPGSFLALLVYEGAALLFAVTAGGASAPVRATVALLAATVLGLLGASAHLFPSPTLPKP